MSYDINKNIVYTVWDMIPVQEYAMDKDQIKAATKAGTMSVYEDRFSMLIDVLEKHKPANVELIEFKIVISMKEAYEHFQEITERGDEGTVIKAHDMVWKDGTSKQQLKVKLVIDAEVRLVGFLEGTKGTKREATFGSMIFETDDGMIKGRTSGFNDEQLVDYNSRREELIGKVFTVEFNDITKGRSNDHYAFSHPRFIEFRDDKDTTDSIERVLESKEMAMDMKA